MELLKKLTQTIAPSGNEEALIELIAGEIEGYVDEVRCDALGNLIAHKKGAGKKLMLAAHTDEIGIIVTYIEENGFLRFHNIGGVTVQNAIGARVHFLNGTVGVVGCETKTEAKEAKLDNLFVDIGAKDRKAAEELVQIGDAAGFAGEFVETDDVVISKALDDRAGCYVLIEALKRARTCAHDLYIVFTVQEEIGARGSATAAYGIGPEMGIAVDVTDTGDIPDAKTMAVKLGGGAAIKVRDNSLLAHQKVREHLLSLAKKDNIDTQMEVLTRGGTDAGAISLSREGVPAGTISIPARYIHSPSEMVSKRDLEACVRLMVSVIENSIE